MLLMPKLNRSIFNRIKPMLFYLPRRFKINEKRKIDDEKCFQRVRLAVVEWSFIVITFYSPLLYFEFWWLCDVVLHFGIIDILQDYDISKKLEHAYKSLQVDPTSISAVDPKLYSKRFRDFIHRIFIEDK